jgi:hypothetical protein
MSQVAISGNASGTGTLTIAAPNTNSNRTLTLPDGTGTFNISGVVNEVPAGTVSAPSIYSTGDTNTGIFFPAADTIAFAEGGAEVMRINSSANVGIGASSPLSKLQVVADQASYVNDLAQLTITGTNTNQRLLIGYNTSTDKAFIQATKVGTAYQDLVLQYGGGNVGIGDTPQGNWKLQVNGGSLLAVGGGATGYAGFRLNSQTLPASDDGTTATLAHAIGGNYSGGSAEMDFFNCVNNAGGFYFYQKTGAASATKVMEINGSGNLTISGSTATKASGTTWANPSDVRLKDNIQNYTKGLPELMQVNVKTWEYNGKGGTTKGMNGLGVIADEVMTVLPDTVETYDDKLNADDEETTAIKKFDATEITWLLVKTVQEQQAIITQLQADVAELKGTTA